MIPAHNATGEAPKHLSCPSHQASGHTPTIIPHKEEVTPLRGKQVRDSVGAPTSCFCGRGPNKVFPGNKKAPRPEGKRQAV